MATLKITLVMAIGPQWPFLAIMAVMTMANGMVPSPRALKNWLNGVEFTSIGQSLEKLS